jgi:hypothetical protein
MSETSMKTIKVVISKETRQGKGKLRREKVREPIFSTRFRREYNNFVLSMRREGLSLHGKGLLKKIQMIYLT